MPVDDQNPTTFPGAGYIPNPAGTTENGEPYWIIDERQISWAEMQQFMWERQAAQQKVSSGGGPEKLLAMPVMPSQPEFGAEAQVEARLERGPESNIERKQENAEQQIETVAQQSAQTAKPATTPAKSTTPQASLLGDSPKLTVVDTSNPASMHAFYKEHKEGKGDPSKSTTFLAVLVGKILRGLFSSEK